MKNAIRSLGHVAIQDSRERLSPDRIYAFGGNNGYLKIGDVARLVGISPTVIRTWESLGLARPRRTASGYRMYSPEDVRLLKRASFLRKVRGMNAPAIVQTLKREELAQPPRRRFSASLGCPASPIAIEERRITRDRGQGGGHFGGISQRAGTFPNERISGHVAQAGALLQNKHSRISSTPPNRIQNLVKPEARKVLDAGPGVRMELLAWGNTVMEPHLFRVAPEFGQRRIIHPRWRRIFVHSERRVADFSPRRRVPLENRRQFLF